MLIYYMKLLVLALFGVSSGMLSAAGLFAVITSVGLINRFAKVTKTTQYIQLYEEMIILGATLGNLAFLFNWKITVELWGTAIIGLICGIFVGCFVICLAETIRALPIFIRRARIANGVGYIILAIALGKGVGNILYQFWLYY